MHQAYVKGPPCIQVNGLAHLNKKAVRVPPTLGYDWLVLASLVNVMATLASIRLSITWHQDQCTGSDGLLIKKCQGI